MIQRFTYLVITFILCTCCNAFAQAVLTDLQVNPVVAKKWQQVKAYRSSSSAKMVQPALDTLPFLDDFSKESVYPDSSMWIGRSVYVNRTYPVAPLSIGVATFDGVDSTGYPYDFTASGISTGVADRLTSIPINLGKYFAPDSVYFSFFYQSQGRGNAPEAADSLILQFKRPTTGTWDQVWAHKGYAIWDQNLNKALSKDTNFHAVILPVIDTAYLHDGFQFRFINHATLSGNLDHWNIDYVYLKNNRTQADTIFEDVAFVYDPLSLLKKYQAMPWEQYIPSELKDSLTRRLSTSIRNSYKVTKNTQYKYYIYDNTPAKVDSFIAGSFNVDPYVPNGMCTYAPFANPPFKYVIPLLSDSEVYTWENILKSTPDFDGYNDTVRFYQKFYNYYAYDDGTAERGYGLSGTNPKLAVRFTLNVADTLKAIKLFFNPLLTNTSVYSFRLAVWADNGGLPGNLIYKDSVVTPVYDKAGVNEFHNYRLSNEALVLAPGTYYFGWMQTTVATQLLNVGFDLNINSQSNTFMYLSSSWQQSDKNGTVMLRPVFGKSFSVAGIHTQQTADINFEVYPNPAQDMLNINFNDRFKLGNIQISMIDMYGKTVWAENNFTSTSIDVSHLAQGLYFLKVTGPNANSSIKRVAVVH